MSKNPSKDKKGKYSYNKPKNNIVGQKFNDLLVIEWLGFIDVSQNKRRSLWKCLCDCGNFTNVIQSSLTTGNTKSCGCRIANPIYSYKGQFYSAISLVYNDYKQSAKRRGYVFEIDRELLYKLITKNCFYCGSPPNNKVKPRNKKDSDFLYNGIDRLDNTEGYVINNIVTCCKQCNFLKNNIDHRDFIEKIIKIYKHINNE